MHNNEPDELDRSIDRALVSYVDAEPFPSLEYRVLESVHRAAHRKLRLIWWAIATPLFATTLLVVILHSVHRPTTPPAAIAQSLPVQVDTRQTISETTGAPSLRSKGGTSQQRAKKSAPESSRSRGWLTATPAQSAATGDLTLHDAAFVALVRERPDQLRALFAKPDPEPIAPVRIDEIEIKPITTDELR